MDLLVSCSMHYWNRDNFEGLSQLADHLHGDVRLGDLARYCELREQGLRAEAFQALNQFLDFALSLRTEEQRDVAVRILEAHVRIPATHQFLAYPLRCRFIEPVLKNWCDCEPNSAIPIAALGLLQRNAKLLRRAIQLEPQNDPARACLVSILLADVDHATHHLVEDLLIGSLQDVLGTLDEAEGYLRGATEHLLMADLAADIVWYRELLEDWESYQLNKVGSFRDWCHERGRTHHWRTIVYYDP